MPPPGNTASWPGGELGDGVGDGPGDAVGRPAGGWLAVGDDVARVVGFGELGGEAGAGLAGRVGDGGVTTACVDGPPTVGPVLAARVGFGFGLGLVAAGRA